MTKCLIALGSNVGERTATLDAAVAALDAADGVCVERVSAWHVTLPVGGPQLEREFLNGAAVIETSHEPATLLKLLRDVEAAHGRERHVRWGDRTLDLDLLLYGDRIVDTAELTVPHPRMSFRRFVLEPAVEIAAEWVHPTIDRTLEQLLDQLETGADCVAIVSPVESVRHDVANQLATSFGATTTSALLGDERWPAAMTAWLRIPADVASTPDALPKLSIVIDPAGSGNAAWEKVARVPGRGPTLRIPAASAESVGDEVFAAIESVWPRLGRAGR